MLKQKKKKKMKDKRKQNPSPLTIRKGEEWFNIGVNRPNIPAEVGGYGR